MLLLIIALVVGFSLRSFVPAGDGTPLRAVPMLVGALVVQAFVAPMFSGLQHSVLLFGSAIVGTGWLIANMVVTRSFVRLGLGAFALGAVLNLIPIVQYGSMPVDRHALLRSGIRQTQVDEQPALKHMMVVGDAPFLSDRFAIRQLHMVASLGDFVEVIGVVLLVAAWPRVRRPAAVTGSPPSRRRRLQTIQQ